MCACCSPSSCHPATTTTTCAAAPPATSSPAVDPAVIDRFLAHRLLVSDVHPVTREPVVEVAHEALLREWPRLTDWIDEDRDTIRLRRALHTTAHDWDTHGRDDAMLFRGSRLAAAHDATRHTPLTGHRTRLPPSQPRTRRTRTNRDRSTSRSPNPPEPTPPTPPHGRRRPPRGRPRRRSPRLRPTQPRQRPNCRRPRCASRGRSKPERQRNWPVDEATAQRSAAETARDDALAQEAAAERARNEALARGLAAQSTRLLTTNENDLALLLAVESHRFADEADPDSTATVESTAALLTALSDDPIRVGDLEVPEGAVVEEFPLPAGTVDRMVYSPDGRTFAAVTQRGDVRLWDADTGQPHQVQPATVGGAYRSPLAMSDTLFAYQSFTSPTGPTALWDIDAQAPWKWQPPGPLDDAYPDFPTVNSMTSYLALSQNGLLARSFSASPLTTSVEVWDTNTGTVVAGPISVDGSHEAVALSDDGTLLAVSVVSPDLSSLDLELIDVRTGTTIWRTVAHPSLTTDTFEHWLQHFSAWVRFSDDGTEVSSIVSRSTVGAIATFDAATGTMAPSNGVGRDRTVMAVSDDLQYLVLAAGVGDPGGPWGTQSPTEVVDADTGDVLASFETDSPPLGQATMPIRPNSTEFAVQRNPGRIVIRDWASVGVAPYATTTTATTLRFGGGGAARR